MYIVGTFNRHHSTLFNNDNPLDLAFFKDDIDKADLAKAAQDTDYQIIDIIARSYFDPKQNKWVKFKQV